MKFMNDYDLTRAEHELEAPQRRERVPGVRIAVQQDHDGAARRALHRVVKRRPGREADAPELHGG